MNMKHALIITALVAVAALIIITGLEVGAEDDETNNGELLPTNLYMTGEDDLGLWPVAPEGVDIENASTRTVQVSEGPLSGGYIEVGIWYSNELDKALRVHGPEDEDVTITLYVNSSTDDGPSIKFRVTIFDTQFESGWYSTNKEVTTVTITGSVNNYHAAKDTNISMLIEVDGNNERPPATKDITLYYYYNPPPPHPPGPPAGVEFPSNATEIDMDLNVRKDEGGTNYYEILVKVADSFGGKGGDEGRLYHVNKTSYIMNITSKDEPENFTCENRRDDEENASEYLEFVAAEYWGAWRYLEIKYNWYYEGTTYANGRKGQGVDRGDYWFNFSLKDNEGNERYYHRLEHVKPTEFYLNLQTLNDYISVVDSPDKFGKTVYPVCAHDNVWVRVHVEMTEGDKLASYPFYVELRDNNEFVKMIYKELNGPDGEEWRTYIYFVWDPTEGTHTLKAKVDVNNDVPETDESDNEASTNVTVEQEATPHPVIDSPIADSWTNEDVHVMFDGSSSENPLAGDLEYKWRVYKDGEVKAMDTLDGKTATSTRLYAPGEYRVDLKVSNDRRDNTTSSIFYINSIPEIVLDNPEDGWVYSTSKDVPFDASGSSDGDDDILYFTWISTVAGVLNKDGGSIDYFMDSFSKRLSGGEHKITLKVADYDPSDPPENGKRGLAVEVINIVVNTPPRIEITSPLNHSSHSGQSPILFDASRSIDEDGDDISFSWFEGNRNMGEDPEFTETLDAGDHEIRLKVSDGYSTSVAVLYITVGTPPTAKTVSSKTAEFKDGKAKVRLDASESTPSNESIPIVRYIWDMDASVDSDGDGTPDNDADYEETGPNVEMVYTKKGTYTAILVVEDQAGLRSQPFTITVKIEKEDDDDDFPIEMVGGVTAVVAVLACVGGFIFWKKKSEEEEEEEEEEYEEAEYEEAEYE